MVPFSVHSLTPLVKIDPVEELIESDDIIESQMKNVPFEDKLNLAIVSYICTDVARKITEELQFITPDPYRRLFYS